MLENVNVKNHNESIYHKQNGGVTLYYHVIKTLLKIDGKLFRKQNDWLVIRTRLHSLTSNFDLELSNQLYV